MTNYKFLMKWEMGKPTLIVTIVSWYVSFWIDNQFFLGWLTGGTILIFIFYKLFIPEFDRIRTKDRIDEYNKGVEYGKRF